MAKIQFLIDENLPPSYRDQLLRRKPEQIVRVVGEFNVPAKGTLDPDILLWCEKHSFLLVTDNRRSMPRHLPALRYARCLFLLKSTPAV